MSSYTTSETDEITKLTNIVRQLAHKVQQLETIIDSTSHTTKSYTQPRTRSHTISTLAHMNDNVVPSMNMNAFIDYLANMPCDAENVIHKKSAEVIADLIIDGYRNLCAQHSDKSNSFIPPILNVSNNDEQNTLCMFDTNGSTWIVCTHEHFSQITQRVHSCVVIQCNRWREKHVGPPRSFYSNTSDAPKEPILERDPRAMAKHQKISTKIYSINLKSTGLITRTKKIVATTVLLKV